jgi:hypothetical protein
MNIDIDCLHMVLERYQLTYSGKRSTTARWRSSYKPANKIAVIISCHILQVDDIMGYYFMPYPAG